MRVATNSGTIPAHIRLPPPEGRSSWPGQSAGQASQTVTGSVADSSRTAATDDSSGGLIGNLMSSGGQAATGMMSKMSRMVGLGPSEPEPAAMPSAPKSKAPAKQQTARAKSDTSKQQPKQTASAAQPKAAAPEQQTASSGPAGVGTINGAQPTVPSGGFDSRFGSWR
jgi:hypothetical protein